jgi:2-polyprenyl-6-methoxyphenol hydroxylase-like FAD-dependent oxidoreductase
MGNDGVRGAVVVGAGIGGLAAAVGLRRVGWDVRVLERAPVIGEVGAGLTLWPNAVSALAALGLDVGDRAVPTVSRGNLLTPKGRWVRRSRPGDVGVLAIHRAELHDVLRKALPESVVETDAEVTAVSSDGKVTVGGEVLSADLVVAADGVNSITRRTLWSEDAEDSAGGADGLQGRGREAVFQGRAVWRGVTPAGAVWPVRESLTLGRGVQVGVLPLPGERVYWFLTVNADQRNRMYADDRAEVLRRVRDWHHPIPELVAATPPDQVLHNDMLDIDPLPSFVKDRVVLLGDAAHAMTPDLGQGACQALEDAVVLAAAVADDDLERYDRERRARVQPMAAAARESVVRNSNTSALAHFGLTAAARFIPQEAWRKATAKWADWTTPELPN